MRTPSTYQQLFAWYRAALADPRHPRHEGDPQCGFFRTRLVKNGPWVPVKITVEREVDPATGELTADEKLICDVGGERRKPESVWTSVRPITRAAYDALVAERARNPAMVATMAAYDLSRSPMRP